MEKWNAAAYLRLSIDDGDASESNSITNQKSLIELFDKKNKDVKIKDYYIDDGYSGTTFDRPDFQRMVKDIEKGKINTIIVKDLSRFGRNYIEVGRYIEQFIPKYNIRFIAINDNVDNVKDPKSMNTVIVPFKNLLNDEYARDISNKIRSVLNTKKENGQFIGSAAPYGYLRNPKNSHEFIVDTYASKVVKKIFKMILAGKSKLGIAEELNQMQVSTPIAYKVEKFDYNICLSEKMKIWDIKKIDSILQNRTYIGYLEQGKKKRISHKVHKSLDIKKDNWTSIPNHHKSLISVEEFEKVQAILYNRDKKANNNKEYDLFSGYLKCADCGNTLTRKKGRSKIYYYCSSYVRNKTCTSHGIKEEQIEAIVLQLINKQIELVHNTAKMIDKISKNKSIDYDYEILMNRIDSIEKEKEKYLKLDRELLSDLTDEIINQTEYEEYRKDYCEHIKELNKIKKELNNKLKNNKSNSIANKKWMSTFTEFEQIEKLNSKTIYELIDNIYIEENGGIKIKFRYQDEFIQAIDFIKINNCAII